jgi:hypothetical protein
VGRITAPYAALIWSNLSQTDWQIFVGGFDLALLAEKKYKFRGHRLIAPVVGDYMDARLR